LSVRLSNRRPGDLLEYFQQIEFVPTLDHLSFKPLIENASDWLLDVHE